MATMNRPPALFTGPSSRTPRGVPVAGFTLIELILAVTILALIFTVVGGVLTTVLGGAANAEAALGADALAAEVEEVIAGDLAFLVLAGEYEPLVAREEYPGFSTLSFHSAAGSKTGWGEIVTSIHRVTYLVEPRPDGSKALFRDEEPLVATRGSYYEGPVLLADNVTLFSVEAYDGTEWKNKWPYDESGPLPAMVRISIDLEVGEGLTRRLLVESLPPVEYYARDEESLWEDVGGAGAGSQPGPASGDEDTPGTAIEVLE